MKVFVAGATGATGQRIVAELCQRQIPVRAMVRNEEQARKLLPTSVELVCTDLATNTNSLAMAIGDCTVVICATGARPSLDPAGPLVMSGADTLLEGSIPRQKVAEACIESLFQPAAANKIVEIVCQSTAVSKDWPNLFASV
jgi:hypothetical protein